MKISGSVLRCFAGFAMSLALLAPALAQEGMTTSPRPKLRPGTETQAEPQLAAPDTPEQSAPEPAPAAKPASSDPARGTVTNLPLPRFVSLKNAKGFARRGPGLTHRIDWVYTHEGMPLKITAEYEHWRRVEDWEGAGGWVHYSLLSGVRSAQIIADMADVFTRPVDGSSVEFRAERNVVGWLLECIPDWCRISVQGEKGWVRKADIWGVTPAETLE